MKRSLLLSLCVQVFAVVLTASFACAQSDELVPNENLVVEGIPKIPASLAQAAGRYSEFRSAAFTSWNPERREMLITTRFGDTAQVHQVKIPGGARTQLTFFPDRVAFALYEPVHGNSFLFLKDVGGGEFFRSIVMTRLPATSLCSPTESLATPTLTGHTRAIESPMARQSGTATMSTCGW